MHLKTHISREPEEIWCWLVNILVATESKNAMRMLELKIERKNLLTLSRTKMFEMGLM